MSAKPPLYIMGVACAEAELAVLLDGPIVSSQAEVSRNGFYWRSCYLFHRHVAETFIWPFLGGLDRPTREL